MPQANVVLHLRPPQIDIAMLQAHFLVGQDGVGGSEGQWLAIIEQAQLVGDNFDLAGRDVLVDGAGVAQLDVADDGHYELGSESICLVMYGSPSIGGDNSLRDPTAIAQIEEDQVAEIAPLVDPAHENNFRARVRSAQLATHMSTFEITEEVEHE